MKQYQKDTIKRMEGELTGPRIAGGLLMLVGDLLAGYPSWSIKNTQNSVKTFKEIHRTATKEDVEEFRQDCEERRKQLVMRMGLSWEEWKNK